MRFARATVVLLALGLVLGFVAPPAGATPSNEAAFVARINELRAKAGAPPLVANAHLVEVSRQWAARMAEKGAIAHRSDLAAQAPAGTWAKLGENVGVGPSVDALHQAFVASPSHHRNLVDPAFRSVGVGIVTVGGTMYVAETFLAPAASAPRAEAAPEAAQRSSRPARPARRSTRYRARR